MIRQRFPNLFQSFFGVGHRHFCVPSMAKNLDACLALALLVRRLRGNHSRGGVALQLLRRLLVAQSRVEHGSHCCVLAGVAAHAQDDIRLTHEAALRRCQGCLCRISVSSAHLIGAHGPEVRICVGYIQNLHVHTHTCARTHTQATHTHTHKRAHTISADTR